LTVFWPGLPRLWLLGEWSALCLSAGFAILLNLVVVATWGWIELLDAPLLFAAWTGTVLFWLVSLFSGMRQILALLRVSDPNSLADLFRTAQGEYLKGNWFEAESALNQLLELHPGDADAHLLLASLLRRTGHAKEARERLKKLATLAAADKWQLEIAREWRMQSGAAAATAQDVQIDEPAVRKLPTAA
jgi:tetratricopeptide (TPR) repeat protein